MENKALGKLIDYLKGEIERIKEYDTSFDSKNWGYEEGILITGNEALTILKAYAGKLDADAESGLHLVDVNAPLLWKDVLDEFYVEHDKQISTGKYKNRMILVFKDWLEKNFKVPERSGC